MAGWRRNTGEAHHNQDHQRARPMNRKPPSGNWHPRVPSWEKQYCSSVGSFPWRKLLDAKRYIHLYTNVLEWKDSAGEEALSNAKRRFYAKINGLPCDISLPDPDKYIDEVDWESVVDPELLSDLDRARSGVVGEEHGSGMVIFESLPNQTFACTGWGDTEEAFQKDSNNLCPVPDPGRPDLYADGTNNSWENYHPGSNIPNQASGWDNWNDSNWNNSNNWNTNNWNGNQWNDGNNWNTNQWNDGNNWNTNQYQSGNAGDWGGGGVAWERDNRQTREDAGGYHSSYYNPSRFHGDGNQMNRGWRRDDLAYQQSSWIGTH